MNDGGIFGLSPRAKRSKADRRLTLTPLGGLGDIGMNCTVFGTAKGLVIVDCGLMFPSDYHLGVDVIIPRFDFIKERRDEVLGIVITHGHEDHIGALPWLLPHLPKVPVHSSPFALSLIEHKLRERGLLERCELVDASPSRPVALGDLTFHFFPVCHSIIDGYALGVETPVGRVIHTGDFKIDPNPLDGPGTDLALFRDFAGPNGALLLLSDSTNVESEGRSLGERQVLANLQHIFAKSTGRIILTLFSSHIQRIQEVFDCAEATGRTVAVSGRSLVNNIEMARTLGRLRPPSRLLLDNTIPDAADDKLVLLVTGSQGEPLSALSRIVSGEHRQFTIHPGDVVIMSSRLIPGNAMAVNTMVNNLYRRGAEVYYDKEHPVHASGHAMREELRDMLQAVRPKYFVPVHGEYRHLVKHARLAVECGVEPENARVVENGRPFTLTPEGFFPEDPIDAQGTMVDGKGVGDVGQAVLKERHLLGGEGVVVVVMVLDENSWAILQGPAIFSKGFVFEQQYSHVLEDAKCLVLDCVEGKTGGDLEKLQDNIRSSLRRFFRKVLDRDPIVVPVVTAV